MCRFPRWKSTWPTVATSRAIIAVTTIVIYQKGRGNEERAAAIDKHLDKGGGLVMIHWAIEGGSEANEFSRRIGKASDSTRTKYRHGALEVDWTNGGSHPIARNLSQIALHDESYWNLVGDTQTSLLAIGGVESGNIRPPLFWTLEPHRGRVFVSIPGHYSWTFDDPIYRAVLLRGIAWVSFESVDRLNSVVPLGVDFELSDTK